MTGLSPEWQVVLLIVQTLGIVAATAAITYFVIEIVKIRRQK